MPALHTFVHRLHELRYGKTSCRAYVLAGRCSWLHTHIDVRCRLLGMDRTIYLRYVSDASLLISIYIYIYIYYRQLPGDVSLYVHTYIYIYICAARSIQYVARIRSTVPESAVHSSRPALA